MKNIFTINAPGKINLHLCVHEKRADGFHDLESIFMALSFGDTLHFSLLDDDDANCQIAMNGDVPLEKNLIYKAVSLFREYTGFSSSVFINVDKIIPFGAGLGGGSSNAASTLIALNHLSTCNLKHEELHHLALKLGSDVPFFLEAGTGAGTAYVSGRGENIEPLQTPNGLFIVLVNPRFSVSTAQAFHLLDNSRLANNYDQNDNNLTSRQCLIDSLAENPSTWQYKNDFMQLFLSDSYTEEDEKKAYRKIFNTFDETEAAFSLLSGSGSTCFGVFTDEKSAQKAEKCFQNTNFFNKLTFPLARSPIQY
jgi:4-diphosphocytidyl-2-C-methyl-D-erythritol kinase